MKFLLQNRLPLLHLMVPKIQDGGWRRTFKYGLWGLKICECGSIFATISTSFVDSVMFMVLANFVYRYLSQIRSNTDRNSDILLYLGDCYIKQ